MISILGFCSILKVIDFLGFGFLLVLATPWPYPHIIYRVNPSSGWKIILPNYGYSLKSFNCYYFKLYFIDISFIPMVPVFDFNYYLIYERLITMDVFIYYLGIVAK